VCALHALAVLLLLALPLPEEPQEELPPGLQARFEEGVAALKAGRLDQAEAAFKSILRGGGDLAFVHNNLGIVYQGRLQHPQAIAAFRDAIRRNPRYVAPRVGLGASLLAMGDLAAATRELEQAVKLAPREALARLQLAKVHEQGGNWAGAVEQYRVLRELAPEEPEYAYGLGKAYLSLSEWCLRELRQVDRGAARVQQALGHNYRVQGKRELAMRAFERAARADPTLPEIHLALAQIHLEEGRWAEARQEIERELSLVPESAGARALQQRLRAMEPPSP
jgi:tetratricopeptide (TPR) repeat protein